MKSSISWQKMAGNLVPKNAFRKTKLSSFLPHQEERVTKREKKLGRRGSMGKKGTKGSLLLATWSACRRMTVLDLFMRILKANSAAKHSALMAEARRLQMQAIYSVASERWFLFAWGVPQELQVPKRYYLASMVHSELFFAIHSIVAAIPTSARARPAPRGGRVFGFVSVLIAINLKILCTSMDLTSCMLLPRKGISSPLGNFNAKLISSYKLLPT